MKVESGQPLTRRVALGRLAAPTAHFLQWKVRKPTDAVRHLVGVIGYGQSHPAGSNAFVLI